MDLAGRAPEFHLVGDVDEISLWVLRAWRGEPLNLAREQHGGLGWFAGEELGSLELADPRYLGVLSTLLAGGKARLTWSEDGTRVTKSLVPGLVIPQWASLLGSH